MQETRAQILARHNQEMQLAVDQHEDRMRSLKRRHQLELCQVEGHDGRTEASSTTQDIFSGALKSAWIQIAHREDTWLFSEITKRFPGVPFESLTERVTLNVYPDRKALVVDGKEVASLVMPKITTTKGAR